MESVDKGQRVNVSRGFQSVACFNFPSEPFSVLWEQYVPDRGASFYLYSRKRLLASWSKAPPSQMSASKSKLLCLTWGSRIVLCHSKSYLMQICVSTGKERLIEFRWVSKCRLHCDEDWGLLKSAQTLFTQHHSDLPTKQA